MLKAQNFSDKELSATVSPRLTKFSPIFLGPKSDGTYRLIFNLKALNDSVAYHHFKLDTLEATLPLITPGCYMTSLDIKGAYYSIPIAPEQQQFLKFMWKGILYQFLCLPMGVDVVSPNIYKGSITRFSPI